MTKSHIAKTPEGIVFVHPGKPRYLIATAGSDLERVLIDLMARPAPNTCSNDDVAAAMVDRFLSWDLPKSFAPDAGISFTPPSGANQWPTGTNLLDADQAGEMVRHMLGGLSPVVSDIGEAFRRWSDAEDRWKGAYPLRAALSEFDKLICGPAPGPEPFELYKAAVRLAYEARPFAEGDDK